MAESTEKKTMAERAADLSEEVLESVRDRQQTVIEAMRKFVDRLDEALPDLGEERAQESPRRTRGLRREGRHDDERFHGQDGAQRQRDAEEERRKASC